MGNRQYLRVLNVHDNNYLNINFYISFLIKYQKTPPVGQCEMVQSASLRHCHIREARELGVCVQVGNCIIKKYKETSSWRLLVLFLLGFGEMVYFGWCMVRTWHVDEHAL